MFSASKFIGTAGQRALSRNAVFGALSGATRSRQLTSFAPAFGNLFGSRMFSTQPSGDSGKDNKDKKNPYEDLLSGKPNPTGVAGLIAALVLLAYLTSDSKESSNVTFQEFLNNYLARGLVKQVEIVNEKFARVELLIPTEKPVVFQISSPDRIEERIEQYQKDLGLDPTQFVPVRLVDETSSLEVFGSIFVACLPVLLLVGLMAVMQKRAMGGSGGLGGLMGDVSKAKYFDASASNIRFKDVQGCQEAKNEVAEFVEFLKNPEKFHALGARSPKGALLLGPPGTGKTLLAKAVAGEAGRPFFALSGSDFLEMYVGVGASRVRDLFKQARTKAPCIIFIDEIDAVGGKRGGGGGGRGNSERDATLNQLLVEMDGMQSSENIVVLAATNRADMLDNALTRPGRFDRQINVDKPDLEGREAIFHEHLAKKKLSALLEPKELTKRLASLTPGMVGADIANICNEAAIFAARRGASAVERDDFENAIDRVMGGLKKTGSAMAHKHTVAYHEAGHCLAGWFLEHTDPVVKVSIVPRTSGALGFAQYLPEDTALHTKEKMLDQICMTLGGRAAEDVFLGRITNGASDDLDKVTRIARAIVSVYGMEPSIGMMSFPKQDESYTKPFSDHTAQKMDEAVNRIINEQYERSKDLLTLHRDGLERLAKRLIEKETVAQRDIIDCLGPRPFEVRDDLRKYIEADHKMHQDKDELQTPAQKEAKEVLKGVEKSADEGDSPKKD